MKDEEKEPLQLAIDWNEPDLMKVGEITDPDDFDLMLPQNHPGLMLVFPQANHGLLFQGAALQKLLFVFDTLIHSMVDSASPGGLEENLSGHKKTKKVTLH